MVKKAAKRAPARRATTTGPQRVPRKTKVVVPPRTKRPARSLSGKETARPAADPMRVELRSPDFTSDWGLLDVKRGRKELGRRLVEHGPVDVVIVGQLRSANGRDGGWGNDDGVSQEFELHVSQLTELALS